MITLYFFVAFDTFLPFANWSCLPLSAPPSAAFFIGLVNTFVHVIMYFYYGLAAIGPHMQKYLWWKRYLTSLQLVSGSTFARKVFHVCLNRAETPRLPLQVQFLLFILYTGNNLLTECDFPDSMNALVFGYCITLIILFSNFYYKSYISRKKQK